MSNDSSTLREKAWALIDLDRPEEAVKLLEEAVALDPENAITRCGLAAAWIECDEPEKALANADKAIALDPEHEWGFRLRSEALLDIGRTEEGLAAANEALRLDADNPDCVRQLFCAQFDSKKYGQAETTLYRLLRMEPDTAYPHAALALLRNTQGRYGEGEQHNLKALSISPELPMALCNLGVCCARQGRGLEAIEHYYQALKLKPTNSTALANLNIQVVESGFVSLEEFLESRGDHALWERVQKRGSLIEEAKAYRDQGRYHEAARTLEEALSLYPRNLAVLDMLCDVYTSLNTPRKALSYADHMISLEPENPIGHRRRARALSDMADYDKSMAYELNGLAIDSADESVRLSDNGATELDLLIEMLTSAGRYLEAERATNRLLAVEPYWWWSHYRAGWLYELRGLEVQAEDSYLRAMSLGPLEGCPANALGKFLLVRKRRFEAKMYLNRAVRLEPNNEDYKHDLEFAMAAESIRGSVKYLLKALWRR